jgi:hypothetical protein
VLHPGFATGDDVEVQVMTLGALLHTHWPSWDLRNAFYPMVFVFPAQAAAHALGVTGAGALILAGRLMVAAIATVTLALVYTITRRLTQHPLTAALAAALVAGSRLHLWFGGSEFPRPVAAVFVTGAFLALMTPSRTRSVVAGVLLGIGGALRFSELMLFIPALLHLALEKRWRDGVLAATAGAAAAAVVLGGADWLFWGEPFTSLCRIFIYTVVEGRSSRGFQPPWYYVTQLTAWTSVIVAGLALWGARVERRVALWAICPLIVLSLLPHKEPRYLIPMYPFMAILAAVAVRDLVLRARRVPEAAIASLLVVALAGEVSAWQFRKSDSAIRLAQRIAMLAPRAIAVQQSWRFGGPLYWQGIPIAELPDGPADASGVGPEIDTVVLVREATDERLLRSLHSRRFTPIAALSDAEYVTLRR